MIEVKKSIDDIISCLSGYDPDSMSVSGALDIILELTQDIAKVLVRSLFLSRMLQVEFYTMT